MEKDVSYVVFETAMARTDRRFKMMWILVLTLVILLVGTNFGWFMYNQQFENVVTVEQDVDTETAPAYVNGTGSLTVNGESTTDNN